MAAVIMLLHMLSHILATLTWKQAPNKEIGDVIKGMESNHFELFGRQVSLGGFYEGHLVAMTLVLLLLTVILWISADHADNIVTRKLLPCIIVFMVLLAATEWIYILQIPAIMCLIAALLSFIAYRGKARELVEGK